jgi:hypothetical protein
VAGEPINGRRPKVILATPIPGTPCNIVSTEQNAKYGKRRAGQ